MFILIKYRGKVQKCIGKIWFKGNGKWRQLLMVNKEKARHAIFQKDMPENYWYDI